MSIENVTDDLLIELGTEELPPKALKSFPRLLARVSLMVYKKQALKSVKLNHLLRLDDWPF